MLIIQFFLVTCKTKEYNSFYYILLPYLRNGFQQPEKVQNIQIQYKPEIFSLEITWSPSLDPDTNQYVPYYFIYLYYEYPTFDLFYDKKYLIEITSETESLLLVRDFRGILYFVITAYDLGSESAPSEIVSFRVPQ